MDVVRRRSGGGAVLVAPGQLVWVEVALPAGDPLWEHDVGRASWWLGHVWAEALASLGVGPAVVHQGGLVAAAWSRTICFAGLGPGEVTVGARKIVGISQRRTRDGAVFHCAALLRLDAPALVALLALDAGRRLQALTALEAGAASLADPWPAGGRRASPSSSRREPPPAEMVEEAVVERLRRC